MPQVWSKARGNYLYLIITHKNLQMNLLVIDE